MIQTLQTDSDNLFFFISSCHTTLVVQKDPRGFVFVPYWGSLIPAVDLSYLLAEIPRASYLADADGCKNFKLEQLPQLYPSYGYTDLRTPAFSFTYADGSRTTDLRYAGHRIYRGKQKLPGLPMVRSSPDAETLELKLHDALQQVDVTIVLTVFAEHDALTQSVRVENHGQAPMKIDKICSASIDLSDNRWEFLHLSGAWARESHICRQPLSQGNVSVGSLRGASSHAHNPFAALIDPAADETHGEVYAMHFVYSGNFLASAQVDMHQNTRFQMGLHPFDFDWTLEEGDSFVTPEVVLLYSEEGLGQMSDRFHALYRDCLLPPNFAGKTRPILLNSWEASYFQFTGESLTRLAGQASNIGAELFVVDDGWFGHRDDTTSSVGDWVPYQKKLGGDLNELIQAVHRQEIAFGLWLEPEMVSPDSNLYRAHPDWVIQAPGRRVEKSRDEYVLDLSNPAVCDYLIETISHLLATYPISYIKWDMNRNFTNLGSTYLPAACQKEQAHRYMLGLYRILDTLTQAFPKVLFEGCAGGGGRTDPGMLYYVSQIWISDDTDALERLPIQYGASLTLPAEVMGCHISAVPNHQTSRFIPLQTRAAVAMAGSLGLEMDPAAMSSEERAELEDVVARYKKLRPTIQQGRLHRLKGLEDGNEYAWMFSSLDGAEVLVTYIQKRMCPNTITRRLRLRGLKPDALYRAEGEGWVRSGQELAGAGLAVGRVLTDAFARQWVLHRVDHSSKDD